MYSPYRELLKHKGEVKAWLAVDAAKHFAQYLADSVFSLSDQLLNNFMDDKGRDVSAVIRGRLYMLKDILGITENLDSYDKMKRELGELEAEGYKGGPEAVNTEVR